MEMRLVHDVLDGPLKRGSAATGDTCPRPRRPYPQLSRAVPPGPALLSLLAAQMQLHLRHEPPTV